MIKNHKVYILMQKHTGLIGSLYCLVTGSKYNHVSVGFSEEMSEFYSFRSKWGFCVEHPFLFNKEYKKMLLCSVFEIDVSSQTFSKLEDEIRIYNARKCDLYYSYFSIILGFLQIKHTLSKGFNCSNFVAETISNSNVAKLSKDPSIYLPNDFLKLNMNLLYQGLAQDFQKNRQLPFSN